MPFSSGQVFLKSSPPAMDGKTPICALKPTSMQKRANSSPLAESLLDLFKLVKLDACSDRNLDVKRGYLSLRALVSSSSSGVLISSRML